MAYEKKNLYPSALKPGVYPDGTTKELGLNSDELENISLGNWNSIVKNDRVFLSEYFKQYVVPEVVEPQIQNIPISLLPLITTNGVFNGSMPRNELNHRFFIEIFGYYLNTKTLLDAGFGTGGGGGTDFPTITYGGVTIPFNGTAPGIDVQGHSDQYIYYSYDPTKYLFNPNIANSFPEFSFSPETNPVVVALTIGVIDSSIIEQAEPFNLDTYVELGWYSQDYVDALRASVEFRNFTYEITQDKTNLSNNDIFQRFAIQTTWGEVYRNEYSDGIGSMLNFNRMSSLTPYSYGHQTSDGFNGPEPIGTRVKIQDNFTNSPFGDGNGNTYQIAGGGQFDSFLEQADNKIYTDWNQPKWLDYVGAQITSLNDFLLANIFFLDSNPIEGDETYGSIADQNPLKIYFNDQNEQQLQDILNKELIFYSIPLNDDLTEELVPDGVTADIINTFISGGPSNNFFENNSTWPLGHQGNLHVTMKVRMIFDRPKTYFNLDDSSAPSDYDSNDLIPSKYFISQHPADDTSYDNNNHEYGYWIGSTEGDQSGGGGPYEEISFYRRASYFTAAPLTFDDSAEVILNGFYLANPNTIVTTYPILLIDDKDENGKYNSYIPQPEQFPTVGYYGSSLESGQDERLAYLTDSLGFPNFPWPPTITIDSGVDYDVYNQLQVQFDVFMSQLVGLENNTLLPEIDQISIPGEKILFERDDYTINPVDYIAHVYYGDLDSSILKNDLPIDNKLLYFDKNNPNYFASSYPTKVNLAIDLYDIDYFSNEQTGISFEQLEEIREAHLNGTGLVISDYLLSEIEQAGLSATNSVYRFQVVQWGDEENILSDDAIKNSYFFSGYESQEYLDELRQSYSYKKQKYDQIYKSKKIIESDSDGNLKYNLFSHNYTTPGPKSIKIIVYRYTKDHMVLIETTLITKNININDGLLLSQDFSIFGGSEYVFLPLRSGMSGSNAIIGGLDSDSKYNNSVEKIKKDDNFIKVDYLNRASSRIFIDDFNDGQYGNTPGQLDLGLTRVYKKPSDLYSFLNADVNSFVATQFPSTHLYDQGNRIQTLPINSSATDIFIDDENCVIDINSENMEYLTIPNKVGTQDKSVLIGDYKVNQPKDGKVSKQGNMKIPKVERNKNKQAF